MSPPTFLSCKNNSKLGANLTRKRNDNIFFMNEYLSRRQWRDIFDRVNDILKFRILIHVNHFQWTTRQHIPNFFCWLFLLGRFQTYPTIVCWSVNSDQLLVFVFPWNSHEKSFNNNPEELVSIKKKNAYLPLASFCWFDCYRWNIEEHY